MLGSIIGGLIGADNMSAAADHQKAALNAIIAKLDAVGMPPDQSAAVILQQFQQQGILTPQLEQMVHDTTSEFAKIKGDAGLRDTQMKALQQMSKYGKAGLTADERAQMNQSRQSVQRDLEAKQQQIVQNMQARGQGGGGSEIAQRLLASQAGADRASEEGDRISGLAQQRALQAIAQSSGMAGQLRNQDFSQDSAKAEAQDQMNRFNVQNQMAINQRNTDAANQSQAYNLTNKQSLANQNVSGANNEKYDQLKRQRQNWQDKLQYAQAYSAPTMALGQVDYNTEMGKAKRAASMGSAFDNTIWDAVGMMYGKPPSDSKKTMDSGADASIDYNSSDHKKKTDASGSGFGGFA